MDPNTTALPVNGSPGSPYTRKVVALLRYRRIAYRLIPGRAGLPGIEPPRPRLLPTVYLPDADGTLRAVTDSTPIIRRLERDHPQRPVLPDDPALAMIDALVEDYADEWLTKAMFHYRWSRPADIEKSATVLPNWFGGPLDDAALAARGREFSERQIGRLRYVGSSSETAGLIEDGYRRLIGILDRHLASSPFVFGARPFAGDFALYGQLTQLAAFDPTPMALTTRVAPRVVAWVHAVDDLSGIEPGDAFAVDALPDTVRELLAEIGRVYVPLLLANADAVAAGRDVFETTVDGRRWRQQAFPYQAKCLRWLREQYGALAPTAREAVDAALDGSGCAPLFDGSADPR